ncbi:ABC transporter substrate-binding protein [Bacillus infantis]|uniref:ABC transporter substrate-binding protein n=1 Tax=Bacillus infantis TaxID=324767 RepID=UPI002155E391|nr:ABC transporter substrate-binding protein [Bacillus infantis]MCR6609461.1 ABC transporter substrate-binding protein [Bacillus infantis]
MKKRFCLYSLICTLFILLSGCAFKDKITIAAVTPQHAEVLNNLFSKEDDHRVEVLTIFEDINEIGDHWNDLDEFLAKKLESNKEIDVIFGFPPEYLRGLVENGSVMDLSKDLNSNSIAPAILGPIREAGSGSLYAITPTFNNYVLAYNKKIFTELNIDAPKDSMTWEEVYDLTQSVQEKSNYKGISLGLPSSDEEFYYLFQILNRPVYTLENTKGKVKLDKAMMDDYWPLFSKLYKNNDKADQELFMQGKVAMAILPVGNLLDQNFYKDYQTTEDDLKIGLKQMPIFKENEGGLAYSDSLFSVSKYSDSAKDSIKLLKYIQSEKFANQILNSSLLPSYWDKEMKEKLYKKYNHDFTAVYTQPGELLEKPTVPADKYLEIEAMGASYFANYLKEPNSIEKIYSEYQNEIDSEYNSK